MRKLAAHVHTGARHVAGGVAIPLDVGDGSGDLVEGCAEIDLMLAEGLAAKPKRLLCQRAQRTVPGRSDPRASE